jgi:hypothetical protein
MGFRQSAFPLAVAVPAMTTIRLPIVIGFMALPVQVMAYTLVYG